MRKHWAKSATQLHFVEWFAEEGKRAYGDVIPPHRTDHRLVVLKQPVGVVGAITPWNFPAAMITRKAGPALAAGCAMVLKPSELTPLTALALAKLGEEAGLQPGVFNVIPGLDAASIGTCLTGNKAVRKISFTGSTAVGKLLLRQSADTVKRVTMELGGNAPFIVFDDADVDEAVAGAIACKFRNAGQTCVTANRFFIQSGILGAFVERFTAAVGKLRVGDGMAEGTDIGPLIDERAISKIAEHVSDAINQGASLVCGGQPSGRFISPTILMNTTSSMKVMREETFGPVAAVCAFSDENEVIAAANKTDSGLAAYFYANNLSRVWQIAEALEYGMIGINSGLLSTELAPFGGIKQSGLGLEGSKHGLSEYLETKYLCVRL